MTQNPFELPQQMRDLAEKNVEQARVAFGQFMDAMTQAVGMWSSGLASNEMTSGFKVVQDRAIHFAKQNAEAGYHEGQRLDRYRGRRLLSHFRSGKIGDRD